MMSNNSTLLPEDVSYNDPCAEAAASGGSYWWWRNLGWYIYTLIQVIYFFGFIGNVLSLLAFMKQCKIDASYYHQLSIIVSDLLSIICNVCGECGYVYLYVWDQAAPDFIQKSYLLAMFAWCYPFADMAATSSLVIMTGACLDRLYALYKPVKYSLLPEKKLALLLFLFGHLIGILTNLHDVLIKRIIWQDSRDSYILIVDADIMKMPFVIFVSNFQIIMRGILLLTLFVIVILTSRKYAEVYINFVDSGVGSRPISEQALTRLMLAQSVLALLGLLSSMAYDIATSVILIPWCAASAFVLELEEAVAIAIQQSANCLIYIGISGKFREAIWAVLTCQKLTDGGILGTGNAGQRNIPAKRAQVAQQPDGLPPVQGQ